MTVIDLAKHADYIRSLVTETFAPRLRQFQIDFDDALQQVYLGLLVRNEGDCPFDPAAGALTTYLYWAVNGMTCNMVAREWHRRRQGVVMALEQHGYRYDALDGLPRREILMAAPPELPDRSSVVVVELEDYVEGEDETVGVVLESRLREGWSRTRISRERDFPRERIKHADATLWAFWQADRMSSEDPVDKRPELSRKAQVSTIARRLLSLLSSKGPMRSWELAQDAGLGTARVRRVLCWLAERGGVRKLGDQWEPCVRMRVTE